MRHKAIVTASFLIITFLVKPSVVAKWEGCEDLPWYYPLQLFWYEGIEKGSEGLRKAAIIHAHCCDCTSPWLSAMKPELKFLGVARSVNFEEVNVGRGETYSRIIAEFENISVVFGEPIATKTFKVESHIGPCNFVFNTGKRYEVIVAYRSIGQAQTYTCLGTREIK